MGAEVFMTQAKGKTMREAFDRAVEKAQYDYGHAGYTGTLAEKDAFVEIKIPKDFMPNSKPETRAEKYADKLISDNDDRIDDKWGPAGGIQIEPDLFLFFGWASS